MRQKILRTLVAAILIASMLTVPAFAEGAVVTGSSVNLRTGPGLNYPVITSLAKGVSVTVTDQSNSDWYAVEYNGTSGFISSQYLSISANSSGSTVDSAANGYINAMYVRFRSGPSTSSSVLGEYNKGKELTITGASNGWTACVIDGRSGYVSSQYVTAGSPDDSIFIVGSGESGGSEEPAPTPTPTPTPTPSPSPTPSDDVTVIPGSGESSPSDVPEVPETPEVTPTDAKPGYIDGDYVRFRTGPSTSNNIIASYNRGKELTITGVSGDWTACTIDGKAGFVYSQYVKEKSTGSSGDNTGSGETGGNTGSGETNKGGNSEPGYITGNNVRFRSAPSMTSDVLGELFYGNAVTITGTEGDWTACTYNGKSGFVYSQYVAKGEYKTPSGGGNSELGRQIADYALQFVGYRYTWGGSSPETGFDCSGLTSYVYKQYGYVLNRVANDQARNGVHVEPDDLQPGDLLCFYSSGSYIGHVGLYIGNGMFVHAANSNMGVIVTPLSGYYADRGYEARRIIQ